MKVVEKLFTKKMKKSIIKKNNLLLTKDSYNRYFLESEGLVMDKSKDIVLDEIMEGLNFKSRIIVRMFPKIFKKIYRKGMVKCFNYFNK